MTLVHNNAVLRTVMSLAAMYYNYLGLRHKYLIKIRIVLCIVKRATGATFAFNVHLS